MTVDVDAVVDDDDDDAVVVVVVVDANVGAIVDVDAEEDNAERDADSAAGEG